LYNISTCVLLLSIYTLLVAKCTDLYSLAFVNVLSETNAILKTSAGGWKPCEKDLVMNLTSCSRFNGTKCLGSSNQNQLAWTAVLPDIV